MKWIKQKNKGTRIIHRFLLFPKTIKGDTRWLEWAYIEQFYNEHYFKPWIDDRWADWKVKKGD